MENVVKATRLKIFPNFCTFLKLYEKKLSELKFICTDINNKSVWKKYKPCGERCQSKEKRTSIKLILFQRHAWNSVCLTVSANLYDIERQMNRTSIIPYTRYSQAIVSLGVVSIYIYIIWSISFFPRNMW